MPTLPTPRRSPWTQVTLTLIVGALLGAILWLVAGPGLAALGFVLSAVVASSNVREGCYSLTRAGRSRP